MQHFGDDQLGESATSVRFLDEVRLVEDTQSERAVRDSMSSYVAVSARIVDGVLFETVVVENSPDWQTTW
ncbi:hypothetical protein OG361_31780 [Streptomyces sp. NBC_00090]|uniref:hypothetical protein n=1 Tax=Streptomyces sp. NBC_00090 TaxID=2903619 RepID=UPI00325181A9